jgi:hypothetical protein
MLERPVAPIPQAMYATRAAGSALSSWASPTGRRSGPVTGPWPERGSLVGRARAALPLGSREQRDSAHA